MKKLLLTLIVSLAFCGSIFAQHPDSHWPGFYNGPYEDQGALYASLMINGEPVSIETANWDMMEVAAFVGDEMRMTGMFLTDQYVLEWGELFPTLNAEPVYYTTPGEPVTFKMFNHATGDLYEECVPLIWDGDGEIVTILTGEEHWEGFDDPDHPLMLNFIGEATAITKQITGYLNGGGWYLISSPVSEVAIDDVENMTINEFDLYYFDQQGDDEGNEWINYEMIGGEINPEFTALELGKGYLYANEGDVTLTFPGSAYDGEGTFDLLYYTTNEDEAMHGWNLVGNPYNEAVTVDRPCYRMVNDAFEAFDSMEEIEPMEGVLVYAAAEGETVTFAAAEGSKAASLALNLSDGNKVIDRAVVGFGEGLRLPKFQFNRNSAKVYITMDNQDYAVVRSEAMGEMPVSFKAGVNGSYSLNLSSNAEFSYLHLIDNLTGADQDLLANPSYSFEAKTTDYANRFRLVFATGNDQDSFAFFSNGTLVVNNEGNATLQVVDVTGRIIKCENINGCANVNIDAASGVYMVRLVNGDNVKTQKVVK